MSRVVCFSFAVMKNFPLSKILFQLAGTQAERTFFFSRLRDVDDGKQQAARDYAALGRLKKISLQVVADCNKIPPRRLNFKSSFFQVPDACIYFQPALVGARLQ